MNPNAHGTLIPGFLVLLFVLVGLLIVILAFVFWIMMIIDCCKHETDTPLIGWLLLIVFAHGLGALIYYLVKKAPRVSSG